MLVHPTEATGDWNTAEFLKAFGMGSSATDRAAALAEREAAEAELAVAVAKAVRAEKYDNMFSSIETLTDTLMPCGKESHPELSIIGAGEFQTHKRRCIHHDCANRW